MSLCLVAIFKNEAHAIKEFVKHYMKQGVNCFCFIDNGSTDKSKKKIKIMKKVYHISVEINYIFDDKKYSQTELYNKYYLDKCKKYEWVIVCDLDEFIYAKNGFKTIKQYLSSLDSDISTVKLPFKMFGSNNIIQQPDSIIQNFTKREKYNDTNESYAKCITRTKYLNSLDIHESHTNGNGLIISSYKNQICSNHWGHSDINENIIKNSYLNLNHYQLQSKDWYLTIKCTRGDAVFEDSGPNRSLELFNNLDKYFNDVEDIELKKIKLN